MTLPANNSVSMTSTGQSKPFDTPRSTDNISPLPAIPAPAALPALRQQPHDTHITDQRSSWSGRGHSHDTLVNSKRSSNNTIDEKQWTKIHNHRRQQSSYDTRKSSYDPEKAAYASPRSSQPISYTADNPSRRSSLDSLETSQARHALKILLFLSGPCVALAFVNLLWTMMAVLVTLLYQPLRLCSSRLSFAHQICHFLAPTLNLQLRCIYSPPLPRPTEHDHTYSASWLVVVHLLAPFLSIGIAVAAWVVAMYWGLARIVGDPSGIDKRDDGVEAVLGLRRWWEQLLLQGVRDE